MKLYIAFPSSKEGTPNKETREAITLLRSNQVEGLSVLGYRKTSAHRNLGFDSPKNFIFYLPVEAQGPQQAVEALAVRFKGASLTNTACGFQADKQTHPIIALEF